MTPEQYENLRRLTKKYRIFFDGPLSRDKWPPTHAQLFHNIQSLGQTRFHDYKAEKINASVYEPWGAQNIRRAERIVERAKRLCSENRNEAGWRLELESEIFSRFTIEVACPHCRLKIWRAEIEAFVDASDKFKSSLDDRRKRREPCRCRAEGRPQDISDAGLNSLFSDRAEEIVFHDNSIQPALPRQEHPDRVYGLRETSAFERALSACSKLNTAQSGTAALVRDAVRCTPFRQDGDPLLFPFLILEAKSGKGQDSFSSIEKQTAFPIRTLLRLQEELQKQCRYHLAWQDGPTVWFLANKGEEWRVSAGFVRLFDEEPSYRIVDLWHGRLVSLDGTLQLLLIIDHIFDWARDIYRPAILRHLKFLSDPGSSNAPSVTHDSDIFSNNPPAPSPIGSHSDFEDIAINDGEGSEISHEYGPLRLLNSPKGVLRDVAFVEYDFLSVTVTGDNVSTILQCFDHNPAAKLARALLLSLCFQGGMAVVDGETLCALETFWTGEVRPTKSLTARRKIYARFICKVWLTDDWVIKKQLSCLAISKDAIDALMKSSKRARLPDIYEREFSLNSILDLFRPFKLCSSDYNLRAGVSRLALSSYNAWATCCVVNDTCNAHIDHTAGPVPGDHSQKQRLMGLTVGLLQEMADDPTQSLIDDIYRRHKIGRREPPEPYIWRSCNTDHQTIDPSESPDPYPVPGSQCLSTEGGYALVVGSCFQRSLSVASSPEVCLFIRSRQEHADKNLAALRSLVGELIERNIGHNRGIFSTCRYAPSKRLSAVEWNIKYTESIPLGETRFKIRAWIKYLREEHGVDRFCRDIKLMSPIESTEKTFLSENGHVSNRGPWTPNAKRVKSKSPKASEKVAHVAANHSPLRYQIQLKGRWIDQ